MLYGMQILVEFECLMQCKVSLNLLDIMQGFLEVECWKYYCKVVLILSSFVTLNEGQGFVEFEYSTHLRFSFHFNAGRGVRFC